MNIGDIGAHDETGFAQHAIQYGIKDFKILYLGKSGSSCFLIVPFDTVLADNPDEE